MKRKENIPSKFESLSELHRVFGLPKLLHPLINFIAIEDIKILSNELPDSLVLDFYKIAYKMKKSF